MTQVFVDLDGVLADFDVGYERAFGIRPDKATDNVDWSKIGATPGFYQNLPMMPDAADLWGFVRHLQPAPIILTGIPSSIPDAAAQKIAWVAKHLGADADVLTCASKNKCKHCQPGDVLIDDWVKYQSLWLAAGGRWITHTSAEDSIQQLLEMGIGF